MDYHSILYFLPYTQLTLLLPHPHTHTPTNLQQTHTTIINTDTPKAMSDCKQYAMPKESATSLDEESEYELERRTYHRRRNAQWKSFLCSEEGCCRSYSSSNALSNHLRLNHNIRASEKHTRKQ